MGVSLRLEELHTEVCRMISVVGGGAVLDDLHVNTGDSSSCTSLSICMSMLTDISKSAL